MPGSLPIAGFPEPLVEAVLDEALREPGVPFAIAGLQGSGKSTLAAQVVALAERRGLLAAVLSLDDVYLRREQRRALARAVHPLLATRGPPGTHDLALAMQTLDALRDGRAIRLPRFDKGADDRRPEADWPRVEGCDLVLVEGWCLRVPPEPAAALQAPLNAVEQDEDADGTWRTFCNDALARDYAPIWARLPRLLFLEPPGFDVVPGWRWEQECRLAAAHPDRAVMDRPGVERFVQLFERVSRQALRQLPALATHRIRLDRARRPDPGDVGRLRGAHGVPPTIGP